MDITGNTLGLFLVVLTYVLLVGHKSICLGYSPSCVYEGHIRTKPGVNWYGFIANATFGESARMKFRFEYPSDKCCHSILFYKDDEASVINSRMNCWDKKKLLPNDQVLELAERFPWSGCHQTYTGGAGDRAVLVCETGRSFRSSDQKLHHWKIALANCARSLSGVETTYRIEVWGHIGPCPKNTTPAVHKYEYPPEAASIVMDAPPGEVKNSVCVKRSRVLTEENWHGYLLNMSLHAGGGFKFEFKYPYKKQIQNVLLYMDGDLKKFSGVKTCWEKESVLTHKNTDDQIIELSSQASWNGCVANNRSGEWMITCRGERRFNSPRNLYVALSNCNSLNGLELDYQFHITGYIGNLCPNSSYRLYSNACLLSILMCYYIIVKLL